MRMHNKNVMARAQVGVIFNYACDYIKWETEVLSLRSLSLSLSRSKPPLSSLLHR